MSNLGEIVSPGINGQQELTCLPCGEELRKSPDIHPIEGAPFLQLESVSGVRGRARERKVYRNMVGSWTNCVLVMIKDLFAGRLSDRLLHLASGMDTGDLEERKTSPEGSSLTVMLRRRVAKILDGRPVDLPQQPSASVRMVGRRSSSGAPNAKNSDTKNSPEPRRGEIWPATVESISLPPAGTRSVDMRRISADLEKKFDNFATEMLRDPEELRKNLEDQPKDQEPYVDPNLKENMGALASRMAESGMLRGCVRSKSTVGLFTVVKLSLIHI